MQALQDHGYHCLRMEAYTPTAFEQLGEGAGGSATGPTHIALIWITCNFSREVNDEILDGLDVWVAAAKERGTKVSIMMVGRPDSLNRPAVKALLQDGTLHFSKHRACHKPLATQPRLAPQRGVLLHADIEADTSAPMPLWDSPRSARE